MTTERIKQEIETRSGYTLDEFVNCANGLKATDCLKIIRDLRRDFRTFTRSMAAQIGIKQTAFDRSRRV
jgi:hypothetical protein